MFTWKDYTFRSAKLQPSAISLDVMTESVYDRFRRLLGIFYSLLIGRTQPGWFRIDRDLDDLAGELVVSLLVVVRYRGFTVHTDIRALVGGKGEGLGLRYVSFRHFLAVDIEDRPASRARFGSIDDELILDLVFARREWRRPGDIGPFHAEEVVLVMDLAVLHVEGPAAESARLCDDHPIGVRVQQLHRRSNRVGTVLDVDERVFRHPYHPRINRQ